VDGHGDLLGESPKMVTLRRTIRPLLDVDGPRRLPPLLILGETGTGKGLLARTLHRYGGRAAGPYIEVSCAAIPETLLEAEMFGFERGAFTGAHASKPGLVQVAHRGVLFLDEVGLLPLGVQAKLLKVVEEGAVRRLGATRSQPVDTWIFAATNEDLSTAVREGRFREDLYYRLAVLRLALPPLRERGADIFLLAEHFLARSCTEYGLPLKMFAHDARAALAAYSWPGNVRELSNIIERAVLLSDAAVITAEMLELPQDSHRATRKRDEALPGGFSLPERVRDHLLQVLADTEWNLSRAARVLGIARNTLRARIRKFNLRPDDIPSLGARREPVTRPTTRPRTQVGEGVRAGQPAASGPVGGGLPSVVRWERRYVAFLAAARGAPVFIAPEHSRGVEIFIGKVRTFGGHIQELSPTSFVATFGLEPIEDAPSRAALAALTIEKAAARARAADSGVPSVKVVIHVDRVLVGDAGGGPLVAQEDRRAASSLLDASLDRAEPDTIAVTPDAASFLERRFELLPAVPLIDGGARGYRLMRRERTGFGLAGRQLSLFVGRDRELELLRERVEDVSRGQGQVVGIIGEPGVGKSRFVYEFTGVDRLQGWTLLSGGGVSYGTSTPYLPLTDMLKRFFQLEEGEPPPQASARVATQILDVHSGLRAHLAPLLALLELPTDDAQWNTLDPPHRRQRTLEAVRQLLVQASRVRPLLLVLEDLHWIDSETQAVLDTLVASVSEAPLLLLVNYRPEYHHAWGGKTCFSELRLEPLPRESVERLLRSLLGEDPSLDPIVHILIERTDGNPFFVEESVRSLIETGAIVVHDGVPRLLKPPADIQIPATVQAVLGARIDRLASQDRDLLQLAAAIGKDGPVLLLHALSGFPEDAVRAGVARLRAGEFLYEMHLLSDEMYTFKHALTHEVAYGTLPEDRRRRLHTRIMETIEQLYSNRLAEHMERLAHHAVRGEVWDKAVSYLRQAGTRALGRSAAREAAAFFEQALTALQRLPETDTTLTLAIDLHFDLRAALFSLAELGAMLEELRRAERLAAALGDQPRLGRAFSYMAGSVWLMGDTERAIEYGRRALAAGVALDDLALQLPANLYLGLTSYSRGDYRQAAAFLSRMVSLAGDSLHERFGMAGLPSVLGRAWWVWCLAELGEFAEATARGEEGLRTAEASGHAYSLASMYYGLGHLHIRMGDVERAIAVLERGRDLCETADLRMILLFTAPQLAYAYALDGRVSEGIALLERTLEQRGATRFWPIHALAVAWLSEAYLLEGRVGDARRLAQEAIEHSRVHTEPGHEAWALQILGAIAASAEPPAIESARAHYGRALALANELEMCPLVARCHLGLGKLYQRTGKRQEAQEHLATATTMYREMDMRAESLQP
jgi:transcriptional regulator with AAA-type ATPase domain/tetratricopeptide (TPR) repeat protein